MASTDHQALIENLEEKREELNNAIFEMNQSKKTTDDYYETKKKRIAEKYANDLQRKNSLIEKMHQEMEQKKKDIELLTTRKASNDEFTKILMLQRQTKVRNVQELAAARAQNAETLAKLQETLSERINVLKEKETKDFVKDYRLRLISENTERKKILNEQVKQTENLQEKADYLTKKYKQVEIDVKISEKVKEIISTKTQ